MNMMSKWLVAIAGIVSATASLAGPTSELYLSFTGINGTSGIAVVQGNSVTSFPAAYGGGAVEIPIAVDGDIRTTTYYAGGSGGQYSLGGTPSGTSYFNPGFDAYDSTTDGTNNYIVNYSSGDVYATGRDFSNPTLLFSAGGPTQYLGITYDETNNSLWVSGWSSTLVLNYAMNGALLGSFDTGHQFNGALALDHADQTLWLVNDASSGTLEQWSKAGALLSAGPDVGYTLGGEFDFAGASSVPEPSPLVLLGSVALLAIRRKRLSR